MASAGEVLDYSVYQEVRGAMHDGRLRLTSKNIVFKDTQTGKADTISGDDVEDIYWTRVARGWRLKLRLSNGKVKRYDGFKEDAHKKIQDYLMEYHGKQLITKDLSYKGWNWGEVNVEGDELSFLLDDGKCSFEIPLGNVSNCVQNKNEVALEFHQNESVSEISIMEVRFHMPPGGDEDNPATDLCDRILSKADVLQAKGSALTVIKELQCLTPRGRYEIKIYPSFMHLHGRTFDFKLTYTSIIRLFLLPHKDGRQMFFVISVDPPIKQGQTRYPYVICVFGKEEKINLMIDMEENELKEKYEGKLEQQMVGSSYHVFSLLMRAVTSRKITVPGNYKSAQKLSCVSCSLRAQAGVLFPLDRGFMYLHKPPIYIRFDETESVNFARESSKLRSFEFHIDTKAGQSYVFSTIDREEYANLFDYVKSHKLRIKNIGAGAAKGGGMDDISSSDTENDPYFARIAHERDENLAEEDEEDSSVDEDFDPDAEDPEAKGDGDEEYDSDFADRSTDSEDRGSDDDSHFKEKRKKDKPDDEDGEPKEKKVRKKKERKPSDGTGGEPRKKSRKRVKLPGEPKRAKTAYFCFMDDIRESIKTEQPGIAITEISKICGERWKQLTPEEKGKYEAMNAVDKERYAKEFQEWKAKGGGQAPDDGSTSKPDKRSPKKSSPSKTKKSSTKQVTPSKHAPKSAETVAASSSGSSSS